MIVLLSPWIPNTGKGLTPLADNGGAFNESAGWLLCPPSVPASQHTHTHTLNNLDSFRDKGNINSIRRQTVVKEMWLRGEEEGYFSSACGPKKGSGGVGWGGCGLLDCLLWEVCCLSALLLSTEIKHVRHYLFVHCGFKEICYPPSLTPPLCSFNNLRDLYFHCLQQSMCVKRLQGRRTSRWCMLVCCWLTDRSMMEFGLNSIWIVYASPPP